MTLLHKVGLYGLITVAVSVTIYLGYNHYTGLLDDNSRLKQDVATLAISIELEQTTNDSLRDAITEWQDAAEEQRIRAQALERSERDARSESRRLNEIFGTHDLTRLAKAKPGLIELRINAGTERLFSILTCETTTSNRCDSNGRPITSGENATP